MCCCWHLFAKSRLTLLQPHGLQLTRLRCPWASPGRNNGVGCHFILQGIFLTQGLNSHPLHQQVGSLPLSHPGSHINVHMCVHAKLLQSCPALCDPWPVAHQPPPSMGFSRQEYWSGVPCPSPGDLRDPGIELMSLTSLALTGWFFTTDYQGSHIYVYMYTGFLFF